MNKIRKIAVASTAAVALLLTGCASAATDGGAFEPRNPRYLVGFQAGGGTDLVARTAAETMVGEGLLTAQPAVENLTGGGGVRAVNELARLGNDSVILQIPDVPTTLYVDGAQVGPDAITPIGQLTKAGLMLVVPATAQYDSLEDMFSELLAKQTPVGIPGTLDQLEPARWAEIVNKLGLEGTLNLVPTAGVNEIVPELLSGRMGAAFLVPTLASGYVETGQLKAIAASSDEPLKQFPDTPTLADLGADVVIYRPQGVAVSSQASPAAVDYWSDVVEQIVASESWKEFVEEQGYIDEYKNGEQYNEWLDEQGELYREYLNGRR